MLFDFGGDPDYYVHTGILKRNFYHWAVLQTLLITEEVVNKLPSDLMVTQIVIWIHDF